MTSRPRKRIAYYGGSFDPVHIGHLEIARTLMSEFDLDEFSFVPAYHAPHKRENKPASPFHRFAMLAAVTDQEEGLKVSTVELDDPDHPYSIETLTKLKESHPDDHLFFVIGADSWEEITTWRRWEEVLTAVDIIVVTRPGYAIGFDHVTEEIRERIVDLRSQKSKVRSQTLEKLRRSDSMVAPGEAEGATRGEEAPPPIEPRSGVTDKEIGGEESEKLHKSDGTIDSVGTEGKSSQSSSLSPHHSSAGPQSSQSIFITDSVFIEVSATEIRRMVREGLDGWKTKVPESASRHIEKYALYK